MAVLNFLYPAGGTPPQPIAATPANMGWQGSAEMASPVVGIAAAAIVTAAVFSSFQPQDTINTVFPDGWRGNTEYNFAIPFPAAAQQYPVFSGFQPRGAIFTIFPDNWRGNYEYAYAVPFPVTEQQYAAVQRLGTIPAPPQFGWWGYQLDYRYAQPFPAALMQDKADRAKVPPSAATVQGWWGFAASEYAFKQPIAPPFLDWKLGSVFEQSVPTLANTTAWRQQPQKDEVFAAPFPVALQQYAAHLTFSIPTADVPYGWWPLPEYAFVQPMPSALMQTTTHVETLIASPQSVDGWIYKASPDVFAKPVPVSLQQYVSHTDFAVPTAATPKGWYPQPPELFAAKYPAAEQQFLTFTGLQLPSKFINPGWGGLRYDYRFKQPLPSAYHPFHFFQPRGFVFVPLVPTALKYDFDLDYRFAKTFPVESQVFSVWDLVGPVPPFAPSGAGKKPQVTGVYPDAPWVKQPQKPFPPIWDKKAYGGKIEQPKPAAVPPAPPPLPPVSIYGRPTGRTPLDTAKLPRFDHLVPQNPMDIQRRVQEAQDISDAIRVLRMLGILPPEQT